MSDRLKKQLVKHEGLRLKPYVDSVGKTSIGVGRNLDDNGISQDEAFMMLDNDIKRARQELMQFEWFHELDPIRQETLIELNFNLGLPRFLTFKKMIAALEEEDYHCAATELLDSKWALQVGSARSNSLYLRLRDGYDYNL